MSNSQIAKFISAAELCFAAALFSFAVYIALSSKDGLARISHQGTG